MVPCLEERLAAFRVIVLRLPLLLNVDIIGEGSM